jgi:hypothetical protein
MTLMTDQIVSVPEDATYVPCSLEELTALADAAGCDLIVGDAFTICVDVDDVPPGRHSAVRARVTALLQSVASLLPNARLRITASWPSRHGEGLHLVVTSDLALTWTQRLVLQAGLGSDLRRELLAAEPTYQEDGGQSVLFRPRRP